MYKRALFVFFLLALFGSIIFEVQTNKEALCTTTYMHTAPDTTSTPTKEQVCHNLQQDILLGFILTAITLFLLVSLYITHKE